MGEQPAGIVTRIDVPRTVRTIIDLLKGSVPAGR
jgi:hypothetical protein